MIDRTNRGRQAMGRQTWPMHASGKSPTNDAGATPSALLYTRGRRARLSDVRVRKLSLLFGCWDNDHDGRIQIADFDRLAECIAAAYDLVPGMIRHALMYAETMAFWNGIKTVADRNGDGAVALDEFIQSYDEVTRRDETFARARTSLVSFFLRIGDRDRDDMLDEGEYIALLACFGISNTAARSAFRRLLAPGTTRLTSVALDRAITEFLRSDDPDAPGTWMLGPLP